MTNIGLIYLARINKNIIQSEEKINTFLKSFKKYDKGINCNLYFFIKSKSNYKISRKLIKIINSHKFKIHTIDDESFDVYSYFEIAKKLDEEYLCFLNTSSEILSNFWLKKLYLCVQKKNVGMCGCTGSKYGWDFRFSTKYLVSKQDFLLYPFVIIKKFLSTLIRIQGYTKNNFYHLRTNAFIIKKDLYIDYFKNKKKPFFKFQAHLIESGKISLSQYIKNKGLKLYIVGKNGINYDILDWKLSNTFRFNNQTNLMILDNQSKFYLNASEKLKRKLEAASWD